MTQGSLETRATVQYIFTRNRMYCTFSSDAYSSILHQHQHHDLYITTTTIDYLLPPTIQCLFYLHLRLFILIPIQLKQLSNCTQNNMDAFFRISVKPSRVLFACDRGRKYDSRGKDPAVDKSKQRKKTGTKKCGCLMKVELRFDNVSSNWILHVLEGVHNHGPSTAATAHLAHRIAALTPHIRTEIRRLSQAGSSPG
jgi:hypothetical protein